MLFSGVFSMSAADCDNPHNPGKPTVEPADQRVSRGGRGWGVETTLNQTTGVYIYRRLLRVYQCRLCCHIGLTIYHGLTVAGRGPGGGGNVGG